MKRPIEKYGFAKEVVDKIKPIVEAIEQSNIVEAEHLIARLAIEVCDKVEGGIISPKAGDDHFLLLDIFTSDRFPGLEFREEINVIIFEGNILHDYKEDFGADLNMMRALASKILKA